ncbi:hypothetical protein AB0C29_21855 [Actinoplanes sp. NPDC048791]|uniref:hypothetical protein n=1 Tax=Actinoplanes sp. NPDC048791 TaxID=3154623 RepID=UPI0033E6AA6F
MFRLKLALIIVPILLVVYVFNTVYSKIEDSFVAKPPADGIYAAGLPMSVAMAGHRVTLDQIVVRDERVRVEFSFPAGDKAPLIECPPAGEVVDGYGQSLVVVVPARSFSAGDGKTLHPVDFECRGHAGEQLRMPAPGGNVRFWASFENSRDFGKHFVVHDVTGHIGDGLVTAGTVDVTLPDLRRTSG